MMLLAPAIAFFAADGVAHGFRPWEKTALAALWLIPLVARSAAHLTFIPLGVPALPLVFRAAASPSGIAVFSATAAHQSS